MYVNSISLHTLPKIILGKLPWTMDLDNNFYNLIFTDITIK